MRSDRDDAGRVGKPVGNGGWLFVLQPGAQTRRPRQPLPPRRLPDMTADVARAVAAASPEKLTLLAEELHLPVALLEDLGLHWRRDAQAFGTPMVDPRSGRVVGVGLRRFGGDKFSVTGSAHGLFIPRSASWLSDPCVPIVIVEGATDVCALLMLGLPAIGRPSANAGAEVVLMLQHVARRRRIVIAGENDAKTDGHWPGREGAERLAQALLLIASEVRVVFPPLPHKDARAWITSGATREDVLSRVIATAPALTTTIRAGDVTGGYAASAPGRWGRGSHAQQKGNR